ncbi:hypothetical protein BD779DRAFT_1679244 [Infundibulicybe gibba]|nr:hypothetical protein BD779DRAFT_1679244 [Infundibulicybe gibba]
MEPQDWRLDAAATSIRVCKWWRQVGLGCPELWSDIRCTSSCSAAWVEKMMERARAVPLSLEVSSYPEPEMDVVGLVAKNLHRCRSLSLHPFWHFNLFQPFKKVNQQAPLLQRLEIKSFHRGEGFTFPPDFLRGRAPNLRHVQIKAYSYIPWHATLFANLVSLEVDTAVETDGPDESSVETLLSALARMSTLEVLSLHNCFPYPTPSTMVVTRAHLPNLKLFRITGTLGDCTRFLRQITTNATAVIRVDIRDSDVSQADVEEFFTVFPSQLCTAFPPITQALQLTWQGGGELGVDARTIQPGTALENSFHVSFKSNLIQSWDISPLDLMWPCFVALASPQLRSFRILGDDIEGWDVEVWRKLAHIAPGLQRLSPGKGALSAELCKTLRPPSEPDLIPADCCLPELSYLELEVPCDLPMPTPEGGETLLSALLAHSLAARAMIGCPTPELVFSVPCERSPQGWSKPFGDAVPGIAVREDREEPVMATVGVTPAAPTSFILSRMGE